MFKSDEERKDKWYQQRWSKFTSSENWKLLGNDKKGNIFGEVGWSYIEQKAMEMCTVMWERPKLDDVKAFLHGGMYEYPAHKAYCEATGNDMVYLGTENPLFLDDEELLGESGGSPDSIKFNNEAEIVRLAEYKCPVNPMNHFQRLKWKDQWCLKEGLLSAYTQIQQLLKISKAPVCDFVSFDERMKREELKIKIIPVYPDKKFQDNLHFRIKKAIEEKKNIIMDYTSMQNHFN